jgi:hypothetical protein
VARGFLETCKRGHELEDWSTQPASPAGSNGRRCVACNRATSTAWNWERRKGLFLTVEEFDQLCDDKFEALKIEKGIR